MPNPLLWCGKGVFGHSFKPAWIDGARNLPLHQCSRKEDAPPFGNLGASVGINLVFLTI